MAIQVAALGPYAPPVEMIVDLTKRYEAEGYDSVMFTDHFIGMPHSIWTPDITPFAEMQPTPSVFCDPIATIASLASVTDQIRLGTCVTDTVRRHPAVIANEWLTLDHISRGRVILGIGPGEAENIVPFGLDFSRPFARFEEALRIIRLLWENDDLVDYDGDFWKLQGAVVGLGPYEAGKYPPIWTGVTKQRGLDITGRLADGWTPTWMLPDQYGAKLKMIRDTATANGRDGDAITASLTHFVLLAAEPERCFEMFRNRVVKWTLVSQSADVFHALGYEHPRGHDNRGIIDYVPTLDSREQVLEEIELVSEEMLANYFFHGTPDDVVAQIRAYEAVGLEHIVLVNSTPLGDPALAMESMDLMAAVVDQLRT